MISAAPAARADSDPAVVLIYDGLGTTARARLWGRVIEDEGLGKPRPGEGRLSKLRRTLDALESDEIPDARLQVQVLGRTHPVQADAEGLFTLELKGPLAVGHHEVTARLLDRGRKWRVEGGQLHIWPQKPGVAVVSDIDDTVLRTGVTSKARMIRRVLFSNAYDLQTYSHAPSLYRAWSGRGYPLVFVSGSPINLYGRLRLFLAHKGFPRAPLLLKNLGLSAGADSLTDQVAYKLRRIAEVQELLSGYRLIMVGDSGEKDPEIYARLRKQRPDPVKAVLIHRVTTESATDARFKGQVLFERYGELAQKLHRKGELTAQELRVVQGKP